MRKLWLFLLVLFSACLLPVLGVAQDVIQPPTLQDLQTLLQSLGGLKGMSALAIVVLVVQGVMLLLRTQAGELLGKYRLLVLYAGSMILAPIVLIASGASVGAALVHANTLAALQVFANQIFKQFITKST